MADIINKKTLEYLAELARIRLDPRKEKKLLADFKNILNYFKELQEVDTAQAQSMTGGTFSKNIFRDDEGGERLDKKEKIIEAFPEQRDGFLKIPPVFE